MMFSRADVFQDRVPEKLPVDVTLPTNGTTFRIKEGVKNRPSGLKYIRLIHSDHKVSCEKIIRHNKNKLLMNIKIPPGVTGIIREAVHVFIQKLQYHAKIIDELGLVPFKSWKYVFEGSLRGGFAFNDAYKKDFDKTVRKYLAGDVDDAYADYPPHHLLPWEDCTPPKDHRWAFMDPLPVDERTRSEVRTVLHQKTVDDAILRDIDVIDALYLLTDKKSNDKSSDGKRFLTQKETRGTKLDTSYPSQLALHYGLSKATKNPCESRTIGLLDPHTRNLSWCAHENINKVLANEHDMYNAPMVEPWALSKSDKLYIMVDLKKSGWTFPRHAVKDTYDVAYEHYPAFDTFKRYSLSMDNITVDKCDSKRGSVVGMDDRVISHYLACAFDSWLNKHPDFHERVKGYFKGDDQYLEVDDDIFLAKRIFRSWVKYLAKLGFLVNAKKSFIGRFGQFCEVVGRVYLHQVKVSSRLLNMFDLLYCENILEMKETFFGLYSQILDDLSTVDKAKDMLGQLSLSLIGSISPEFHPKEAGLPVELGGWWRSYSYGMNTLLVDYIEDKFHEVPRPFFELLKFNKEKMRKPIPRRKKLVKMSILKQLKDENGKVAKIVDKLLYKSIKPGSKLWVETYARYLEERQALYRSGCESIVASYFSQYVLEPGNYAIPPEWLTWTGLTYDRSVLRHRFKNKKFPADFYTKKGRKDLRVQFKHLWEERYLVDKIRAVQIVKDIAYDTQNPFNINYIGNIPFSTYIWSLCPYVFKAHQAIPIHWFQVLEASNMNLTNAIQYYRFVHNIDMLDFKPSFIPLQEDSILTLFRGPADADVVTFDPEWGLPVKYNSSEMSLAVTELKQNPKTEFRRLIWKFFPFEMNDEHFPQMWFGLDKRNAVREETYGPLFHHQYTLEEMLTWTVDQAVLASQGDAYDPEVFQLYWAMNFAADEDEHAQLQADIRGFVESQLVVDVFAFENTGDPDPLYKGSSSSADSLDEDESDELAQYIDDATFLNSDSDAEENPYGDLT